jgi:hypothetical protein
MKAAGLLLLFAGWLIVLFAIALLPSASARIAFILAGFAVELLGLGLAFQANLTSTRDKG